MGYIEVPIETEPTDLAEEAFGYIETRVPGWLPSPGNLEAWLIEANAQIAGELRELAALVPDSIFEYFGESIVGLPRHDAVQATGYTTWKAIDLTGGYRISAGTLVGISPTASSDTYAFEVVSDVDILAGTDTVNGVEVRALEPGAAASGISGSVEMLDTLDFVAEVTLDQPTSGGVDAETVDHYLARLSDLFTLLSPRPILPQDFAVLAQRSHPSVARAVAIDLYNPGPPVDANCPRCVTVVLVDGQGNPVPAQVKADVDALLQAEREVNFLVFVEDPTYTTVDVQFEVVVYPGYDPATVQALVVESVQRYLSPATWGVPPYGDTSARSWINDTHVRYLEVAEYVNRTDGVHYIVNLAIRVAGGAFGTADLTMPGVAPLPRPGAITGTAHV